MEQIKIPLNNGYNLVALKDADPDRPNEIHVCVTDADDVFNQDIVVVQGNFAEADGQFEVLVYADMTPRIILTPLLLACTAIPKYRMMAMRTTRISPTRNTKMIRSRRRTSRARRVSRSNSATRARTSKLSSGN